MQRNPEESASWRAAVEPMPVEGEKVSDHTINTGTMILAAETATGTLAIDRDRYHLYLLGQLALTSRELAKLSAMQV